MTTFVSRAQWGARPRESGTTDIAAHPSITFHWVGGGWEFPWSHTSCDDKVRNIQASHMDDRGWSDIAYNLLVCPHDVVYDGRGYDRRSSANGSDAANFASFAICALWGSASTDDPLPNGLKDAFLWAVKYLQKNGGATSVIKGHRDWKSTDCPGAQIYAWIKAGCPDPTPTVTYEDAEMLSQEAQRQVAQTMVAVLDQEVKDGQSLHELVQMYSAFNARNTGENRELAVSGVDLVLKDDFNAIANKVVALENHVVQTNQQLEQIQSTLNQLLQKQ